MYSRFASCLERFGQIQNAGFPVLLPERFVIFVTCLFGGRWTLSRESSCAVEIIVSKFAILFNILAHL